MATIALVRSAKSTAGGTPNTCTVVAPAVGNLWVVQVHSTTDSGTAPTCNNSLVQVPSATVLSGSTRRATTFYKIADGSETTSVTATQAGVTSLSVQVYEYSSTTGWPATPYDQVTSQTSSGASVATLTALSVTTTSANEVLNIGVALAAYTAPALTNSFVVEQSDTTNLFSGDLIVTSTGTYSTVPSWTTARVSCAVMVSFMANAPAASIDTPRPRRNPERILGVRGPFKPTQPVDATAVIFGTAALSDAFGDLSASGVATPLIPQERPRRNPERIRPFGPFKPTRPVELHPLTVYGAANLTGSGDLSVDPRFLALDGTSGTWASTPDSVANSITGDIIVRIDVALADWSPTGFNNLVSKGDGSEIDYDVAISPTAGGIFQVSTSPDGTLIGQVVGGSSVPTAFADDTNHWVQWKRVVNDGSGNVVDTFEECAAYNPADPTSWSGTPFTAPATSASSPTSIFDGTAHLYIGAVLGSGLLNGRVYRMQLLTGAGTLKVDFRPTDYVSGSTLTSSATGEVWTLGGHAAIQATPLVSSSAALSGAGSLSATGTIGSAAALSGAGSLSAVPTTFGTAALSGAGSLTAIPTTFGLASLSGAGSLAATITAGPILGTAVLTGTGSLNVRPADPVICYPTHAIGGTSGVTRATGAYDGITVALGSSTGVTHADDICLHVQASVGGATGVVALSGAGSLTATGAVGTTVFGGAAISGAGSLSATGVPTAFGVSALAGAGSLSAVPTIGGVAALSGAGSLSASGTLNRSAALSGAGSLTAIPTTFGLASLSGAGDLSATLTQSLPDLVPTGIDWT